MFAGTGRTGDMRDPRGEPAGPATSPPIQSPPGERRSHFPLLKHMAFPFNNASGSGLGKGGAKETSFKGPALWEQNGTERREEGAGGGEGCPKAPPRSERAWGCAPRGTPTPSPAPPLHPGLRGWCPPVSLFPRCPGWVLRTPPFQPSEMGWINLLPLPSCGGGRGCC